MEHLISWFVVLFIVVDPIGVSPMFVALTRDTEPASRRAMALRATALAAAILLVFYLVGDILMGWLGVGIAAFRIAGGVLLFLLAIDMVFARQSGLRSTTYREEQEAQSKQDVSVFPLAFPLIAGPGALTTVLLMTSTPKEPLLYVGMLLVVLTVLGLTLLSLLAANTITHLLGETGANVISRLLGLILAALAAQYVIDGVKGAFAL